MKLLVCTNFAQPFHTGGAERIVQQITEFLAQRGFVCTVFCQHGNSTQFINQVKIVPVGNLNESQFIEKIIEENPDHLFVYSDWFFMWPAILSNIDKLNMQKSIGLVGMNRMRSSIPSNKYVSDSFKKNNHHFKVIAHAENYIDCITCREWGVPVEIIHNSVDLSEFIKSDFDFKKHYGIKTDKMLLCVSNFFPGKGQEYLIPIINRLYAKYKDFTFVFISSTLAFQPGNKNREFIKSSCDRLGLPVKFLNDIPREHVVQSYFACDAFVFPSQQECGPIVILEAMAASKPWIAIDVGHIRELLGGICIQSFVDNGEKVVFKDSISSAFLKGIESFLLDKNLRDSLGELGRKNIEKEYNWDKIKEQYLSFFLNKWSNNA